jgi:hypothetical protein
MDDVQKNVVRMLEFGDKQEDREEEELEKRN